MPQLPEEGDGPKLQAPAAMAGALMVASILFVHSPMVGPSTWAPSAELMARRGFRVRVPDLTGMASAPAPMGRFWSTRRSRAPPR
jgi:hypothetical protein